MKRHATHSHSSCFLLAGILVVSLSMLCWSAEPAESPGGTIGSLQGLDPRFEQLVPAGAQLEIVAEGFDWSEGPLWVPQLNGLLFSDIPRNSVFKWKEGEGVSLFLKPSGYTGKELREGEVGSNGLLLDPQGQLVLCQHGNRQVARMDAPLDAPTPRFKTLAKEYQGKRLNSPNDGIYHSSGALYFTDPPYGLEKNMDDPAKELDFQGVYRLGTDGRLTLLTKALSRPNGIAFSPDEEILYVANSDPERAIWMAFPVSEEGTLGDGEVLFDATRWVGQLKGLPDGMTVDQQGNLFATGPGGVLVFSPAGDHLGTLLTTQATSNCTFGDDGRVLYITADMYLLRIPLATQGMGF